VYSTTRIYEKLHKLETNIPGMLKDAGQRLVYKLINPIIKLFIHLGITPNMITSIGLMLNVLVAVVLLYGAEYGERTDLSYIGWAGALILFAGLFDMMDGRLARLGNLSSKFGALYDSALDRYSELFMFMGIIYYLISHDYFFSSIFAFVAMIGSLMVSYVRARAEGLGVDCSVGVMQRPERILIIGVSAILCGVFSYFVGPFKFHLFGLVNFETISIFTFPLAILAILANQTALKRLTHSKKELETTEAPRATSSQKIKKVKSLGKKKQTSIGFQGR